MAAFGVYMAFAARGEEKWRRIGHWALGIVIVLTGIELVYRYTAVYSSLTMVGGFEALLFIAFSVGMLSAVGTRVAGVALLPMIAAPIVFVCLGAAAFRVDHHAVAQPDITAVFILGHVVPSLWGYTAFVLAFVASAVYFLQERSLKRRHFGPLFERLPSLVTLEKGIVRLLVVGFILFTAAIAIGAMASHRLRLQAWLMDSKVILSTATWLVYALILGSRVAAILNGRRVALASVVGMAMIVLTFVVVEKVYPGWHAYGWKASPVQTQTTTSDEKEAISRAESGVGAER